MWSLTSPRSKRITVLKNFVRQPKRLLQHNLPTGDIAQRQELLSQLEHVNGETIGVNLAIHVGPKAIHLIALDIFDGHQWSS
jgi:hypothetical protein